MQNRRSTAESPAPRRWKSKLPLLRASLWVSESGAAVSDIGVLGGKEIASLGELRSLQFRIDAIHEVSLLAQIPDCMLVR